MTNKNKVLIGCLALLLVMSMGYALFSDTISINGTATAKGDFAYEIETMKGINSDIKTIDMYAVLEGYGTSGVDYNFANIGSEEGVSESSISHTKNTITYTAALTNPGQNQFFTAKITNVGTIPMTLDIYYDFVENAELTGNLLMSDGTLFDVNSIKSSTQGGPGWEYDFTPTDILRINQMKYQMNDLLEIFVSNDCFQILENDPEAIPIIETGESIYIVFSTKWMAEGLENKNVIGFDLKTTNTLTLPVKQVTVE